MHPIFPSGELWARGLSGSGVYHNVPALFWSLVFDVLRNIEGKYTEGH